MTEEGPFKSTYVDRNPENPKSLAVFSIDGRYRYFLQRNLPLTPGDERLTFIMLNPSIAGASTDDPTIRRCRGYAHRFGASRLMVVNLYPYIATNPHELMDWKRTHIYPDSHIERNNQQCITTALIGSTRVIAAWGAHSDPSAVSWVRQQACDLNVPLHHLGPLTKNGSPRHPLYLKADIPLITYPPALKHALARKDSSAPAHQPKGNETYGPHR